MSDRGRGGRGRGGADRGGGSFRGGGDRGGRVGADQGGGSFRGEGDRGRGGGGDRGRGAGGGDRGRGAGGGDRGRGGGGDRGRGGGGGDRGRGRGGSTAPVVVFRNPSAPLTGPDGTVMNIENVYMQSARGIGALGNLNVTEQFPSRPGYGTVGKKLVVYANYLRVQAEPGLNLTRYNVEITPEAKGRKLSRIIQLLIELPQFAGVASDYKSMIVARQPLTVQDGQVFDILYRGEGEDTPLPNAITYQVRVVTPLSLGVIDLVNYLSATASGPAFPQKLEIIQALNVLLGNYPQANDGTTSIAGNRHFSLDRSQQNAHNIRVLGGGLESLRGFFQSVRPATGGILLNVNVTHGVFLEPLRVDILFPRLGTGNRLTLQKKMKLVRVQVIHIPPKKTKSNKDIPRIKTIFGLAHPQDGHKPSEAHPPQVNGFGAGPKDVKFWLSDVPLGAEVAGAQSSAKGKKPSGPALPTNAYISVFDYFKRKYPNIQLNERVPVVNVGNRENPSYLPAEVCVVLPGQTIKRRLSPEQTANMITFACRKPYENANSIVGDGKTVLGLNPGQNTILGRFGLAVGTSLITVAARELVPPLIKYRDSRAHEITVTPRNGSWNMANIRFHTANDLGPWTYVWFRSDRQAKDYFDADIQASVAAFKKFLADSGINSDEFIRNPPPPAVNLTDGNEGGNETVIRNVFRRFHTTVGPSKPRFVLCILPYADVAIYNSIKTVADTKAGIHTVCVVGSKFVKKLRQEQYFGNISLKFNMKAGGINQTLDPSKLGIVSEGRTMVVGLDVTHPSPGSKDGAPSVAAIVASVDKFLGQWPGAFSIQEGRKEMISALEALFLGRLRLWQKHNRNALPENIILYRDGVSEGQYQQLLEVELPLIRNACRQAYPATATNQGFPKVSIIVCGKRHHTRFYPTTEAEADRSSNCNPGTVVDRGVTEARFWDFFLQPHSCLQGTARPGHYVVVLDEVFRGRKAKPPHQNAADALEDLTLNMCHLFGRATKAVSLCPAAYYADLLCTRVRCYLSDQFDPIDTSATPSVASGVTPQTTFDVAIPPNIADTMWYI